MNERPDVPMADLEELDLDWAYGVWKNPSQFNIEEIRQALSIVRFWHADRVDLLRRASREGPTWNDLKHEEEVLEVYITDLKDALWTTAHINKQTGGYSGT